MKALFLLLALALAIAVSGDAQTTGAATIVGTVSDTTGAVIPSAKVTVVNIETNFNFEGLTNQDGYYYVPYLRPGTYKVTVEAAGFKKYVRDGIELRTNDEPRIDVKLEVGNLTESVEVQAAASLLETETAVSGGVRCPDPDLAEAHLPHSALSSRYAGDQRAPPERPARAGHGL